MIEVSARMDSATIVKTASFLLDHRRLSAGEQSFLINVSARASRAGTEYILDSHDQALIDAGRVAARPLPGHAGGREE